jgi:hypothetical protein
MHTALIDIKQEASNPFAATITVEGILDMNQAEMIRDHFLECLDTYHTIEVIIQNTDKIDVSFVQILYAFQLSAEKKGIKTSCSIRIDPELESLLKNAGIDLPALFN